MPDVAVANSEQTWVNDALREQGIGKTLMRNIRDISLLMGIKKIEAYPQPGGSYFAAKCGFIPDQTWNNLRLKVKGILPNAIKLATHINDAEIQAISQAIDNTRSDQIRVIAACQRTKIKDNDKEIGMGRALLSRAGVGWHGFLNIVDDAERASFDDYVNGGSHYGAGT